MLSTADANLVQRDQAIAGMKIVMDPNAFLTTLQVVRPELDVTSVQLTYLRYRPTRSCLGAYRVRIQDTVTPMLAHVTAYHGKAWGRLSIPIDNDHHIMYQDQVLISLFPGDAILTSLAPLINHDSRQDILKTLLPASAEAWPANIETLAYKPQRRYVGRINFEHGNSVVVKHYRENEYPKAALATMIDCPATARLRIPRTLGRSQHHQSLAFEWLPGRVLSSEITTTPAVHSFYACGAALAEFHALATDNLKHRTASIKADKLTAVAKTIAHLHSSLASLAQDIATGIAQKLLREAPAGQRIHGDFSLSQVILMEKDQVAIIDHDENVCGNPMEDIGLFIARLLRYEHTEEITHNQAELLIAAFIEGYQSSTQQAITRTLHCHIAAGLFSLSHRPFRAHEPNWPEGIQRRLEQINDILHSSYPTA
ncbi:MAG TPA: aminoglycoside phosphotransferase family protein [Gammaproteobacteria bacterium]|nr:aminoglycoside phosphotransferase family protein [Gammaproteobacteria bacterium]